MNKQELLKNIEQWAKAMEHQKIIDAINALPENERDYALSPVFLQESTTWYSVLLTQKH